MEIVEFLKTFSESLGSWMYILAFLFALSEATIGISMLTPGSSAILAIGALAAFSDIKIYYLILFSIIGAVLGDNIGYFLGSKFGKKFLRKIKFIKEEHIAISENFIKKHGAKSVFLGRFAPFTKELIPFIAGAFNMDRKKFIFYNILGAIGWSFMWPGTGYIFAKAVLSDKSWVLAFQLAIAAVIIGYLVYLAAKETGAFEKVSVKKIYNLVYISKFWSSIISLIILLYSLLVALIIAIEEKHKFVQLIDYLGFSFVFEHFHFPVFLFFFLFTWTAKWYVVLAASLFVSFYLCLKNCKRYKDNLIAFYSGLLSVYLLVFILKNTIKRPRPEYILVDASSFSFPSGHAAVAAALSSISILLLWKTDAKYKTKLAAGLLVWSFAIYASRIYLGAHYITDVLAGVIVGISGAIVSLLVLNFLEKRKLKQK